MHPVALWREARSENREGLSHQSSDKESTVTTQLDQDTVEWESRGNVLNDINRIQWVGYKYYRKW